MSITNDERNHYPDKIESVTTLKSAPGQKPERLDKFLTRMVANSTRNKVQTAIEEGQVTINGKVAKASKKVQPNDVIECRLMKAPPIELIPEEINLNITYEDDYLLVVDKPAGMCVHPGFGNRYGTLVNALLYHFGYRESIAIEGLDEEEEEEISEGEIFSSDEIRPGLVHRIDKDTSGLLVVAKDPSTHARLAAQFADKSSEREYIALVWGNFSPSEGDINDNIIRSPKDRKIFTTASKGGKTALTHYTAIESFDYTSLVKFKLSTGRTHQIRVHSKSRNHSIFGDATYGGDKVLLGGENVRFRIVADKCLSSINRQLLHARTLGFRHPATGEFLRFESAIPPEFEFVLSQMRQFS